MKTKVKTTQITTLGLMMAILLLMAYTPLGYLNIGPLAITFNVIPVAISAIALGPAGGAAAGSIFGLTSFLQCVGIGGQSLMGVALFNINPVLAFNQRFIPRFLGGLLLGYFFRRIRERTNPFLSWACSRFFSAFLNSGVFMAALVLLFGNTEYIQEMIGGRNIIVFICTFVGINAVCEMIVSTVVTAAVGTPLSRYVCPPEQAYMKSGRQAE